VKHSFLIKPCATIAHLWLNIRDSGRTHEVQAQDPKRLMVSGQNSTAQVIEPRPAVLAPVALPMPLIMAMADHRGTGTGGAANSFRPSMVPDQLIALSIKEVRVIICGEAMVGTG
jgi:hypothetical protein